MCPDSERGRPGGTASDDRTSNVDVGTTIARPPHVAEALRRRRAAAVRVAPLKSGVRDPLDKLTASEAEDLAALPAWEAACAALRAAGVEPLPPAHVAQALDEEAT